MGVIRHIAAILRFPSIFLRQACDPGPFQQSRTFGSCLPGYFPMKDCKIFFYLRAFCNLSFRFRTMPTCVSAPTPALHHHELAQHRPPAVPGHFTNPSACWGLIISRIRPLQCPPIPPHNRNANAVSFVAEEHHSIPHHHHPSSSFSTALQTSYHGPQQFQCAQQD
jgi:hypothetical protein